MLVERQRLVAKPGRTAHIAIYDAGEVFAPVKVVIAEHPAPIRCVLSYLPVYPARGILGLVRPGQHLWLAYAVTAVLNSPCGRALYERLHWSNYGCPPSSDGLDKQTLYQVPIARTDVDREDLRLVAELTHQITTLYQAERECLVNLARQRQDVLQRLHDAVPRLLGLSEQGTQQLLGQGQTLSDAEGESEQHSLGFPPSELLPPAPKLPPVDLLIPVQRRRLETLRGHDAVPDEQEERFERLKRIAFWEGSVNRGLPEDVQIGAVEPAA